MHVLLANQITPLLRVAGVGVSMYGLWILFRNKIAAVAVLVPLDLRKRAPQNAVFIIAGGIVMVDHKIGIPTYQISVGIIAAVGVLVNFQRLRTTYRNLFLHRCYLGITSLGMSMLWNVTLFFHGDGRKNQRVGGTEYHHAGKHSHHLMPAFLSLMSFRVFLCVPQNVTLHIPIHQPFYLNAPKSGRGQTRNTIFPTICSLETHPTVVLRESTEVDR